MASSCGRTCRPHVFQVMRQNRRTRDLKRAAAREEYDYCREWMLHNHGVDIDTDFFQEAVDAIDAKRGEIVCIPGDKAPPRKRRDNVTQAIATFTGLAGAWLLATKGQHAAWGWWAFLASNLGWIAFGYLRRLPWLVVQQIGYTASSVWGLWTWILVGGAHG